MDRYAHSSHAVYLLGYHLVWATKYRRDLITEGTVDVRLKEIMYLKAAEHGWEIRALETMPDHVHVFVYAHPTDAPNYIAAQFKGVTSNLLRKEFIALRSRVPTLWTRSYFVASVGEVSADSIAVYIESQRTRP